MEILETAHDGLAMVRISGSVNSGNAPELNERLTGLIARTNRALVIDLSDLVHMTSAGFRSLLRAEQAARAHGHRVVLCGVRGLMRDLFEVGGFLTMFDVVPSREDAIRKAGMMP